MTTPPSRLRCPATGVPSSRTARRGVCESNTAAPSSPGASSEIPTDIFGSVCATKCGRTSWSPSQRRQPFHGLRMRYRRSARNRQRAPSIQRLVDEALFLNRVSDQHPLHRVPLHQAVPPTRRHRSRRSWLRVGHTSNSSRCPRWRRPGLGILTSTNARSRWRSIIMDTHRLRPDVHRACPPSTLRTSERRHGRLSQASKDWRASLARPWYRKTPAILLDESDEGQRLRSSKPFAGIVTEEERVAIIERFTPQWPSIPFKRATGSSRRLRSGSSRTVRSSPSSTPATRQIADSSRKRLLNQSASSRNPGSTVMTPKRRASGNPSRSLRGNGNPAGICGLQE